MGGRNSCYSKSDWISTGRRNHPNSFLVLVSLQKRGLNGISDPSTVRAQLRIVDLVDLEIVFDTDGALGGGRRRKAPKAENEDNGRKHSGNAIKHSQKLLSQALTSKRRSLSHTRKLEGGKKDERPWLAQS